jgi:hypothetical protein
LAAKRKALLISIPETAKRHGRRALDVLDQLATVAGAFPDAVLRYIDARPGIAGP